MKNYTPTDLLSIVEKAGSISNKGIVLTDSIRKNLPAGTAVSDLRTRSVYFVAITAHDLELGIRVVREMLFSPFWDLLYQPNGPAMYPGATVNANHFQEFVQRGAFLSTCMILEGNFRAVHRALAPGELRNATDSWWKIWTSLEQKLRGFKSSEDRNLIRLLATIRNCIHDNGVHRGQNETIMYANVAYTFRNGTPPDYLTLEFILMCLDETMSLIAHVSLHTEVKHLTSVENVYDTIEIPDPRDSARS